jgi:hypothetical protein
LQTKTPSNQAGPLLFPPKLSTLGLLLTLTAISACNATSALRGVGADATTEPANLQQVQIEPVTEDEASNSRETASEQASRPLQTAAPAQSGTAMNMVPAPPVTRDAFIAEDVPPPPDMAPTRDEAIRQIREKASETQGEMPNIFAVRQTRISRMTAEQQMQNAAELANAAEKNAQTMGNTQNSAGGQSVRNLEHKATTHYEEALKKIEN